MISARVSTVAAFVVGFGPTATSYLHCHRSPITPSLRGRSPRPPTRYDRQPKCDPWRTGRREQFSLSPDLLRRGLLPNDFAETDCQSPAAEDLTSEANEQAARRPWWSAVTRMSPARWTAFIFLVLGTLALGTLASTDTLWTALVAAAVFIGSTVALIRAIWVLAKTYREETTERFRTLAESLDGASQSLQEANRSITDTRESAARLAAISDRALTELAKIQLNLTRHHTAVTSSTTEMKKEFQRATRHRDKMIEQLDGIISLYTVLRPARPYPQFGNAAVAGDSARRYISMLFELEPNTIIELGSGLSTVLSAKALDMIGGDGHVVSLDHDEYWADATRTALRQQGLLDRATVQHAPLVDVWIDSERWKWYDLKGVEIPSRVDVVFVDGPPMSATGPLGRYPALPLLIGQLSDDAVILVDDGYRPGESEIVDRWIQQIPGLIVKRHKDSKGTIELVRTAQPT
jgi:predicted O-methyltransferase YrrM